VQREGVAVLPEAGEGEAVVEIDKGAFCDAEATLRSYPKHPEVDET
jgi:hypothetical protein